MFFLLSKIVTPLLQPLTPVILLLVVGLFWHRRARWSKACGTLALLWLFLVGTYPLPDFFMRRLETLYQTPQPTPTVDAVVVLSGIVYLFSSTPARIELNEGAERIIDGIKLVKQGTAAYLIISGGSGDLYRQDVSEAALLRQLAIDFGLPAERVLIDATSRNTHENAVNTKALLAEHGLARILLVTSASHLPRAFGCFKKVGIDAIPYPVDFQTKAHPEYRLSTFLPNEGALRKTSALLHEYFGLLTYRVAGYI